jgi:hypothetical protein
MVISRELYNFKPSQCLSSDVETIETFSHTSPLRGMSEVIEMIAVDLLLISLHANGKCSIFHSSGKCSFLNQSD